MKATQSKQTANGAKLLATRHEYAARVSFSLRKLDMLIAAGIVPAIKFSAKCTRIPIAEADRAIMSLVEGGVEQ
jgi:hypothetical protein